MAENLIKTQELGKPRPKVIPKPIRDIYQRMLDLRAEREAREESQRKKVARTITQDFTTLFEVLDETTE